MNDPVIIRRYGRANRSAVREICLATADRGGPATAVLRDGELVADLVTRYYTDIEPQHSWVAETGGQVVGYVTGTVDTAAFRRLHSRRVVWPAIGKALWRGKWFHRDMWGVLVGALRLRGAAFSPRFGIPPGFPAHLHINVLASFRGQHVGDRLMKAFLAQLQDERIAGVHATVHLDNPAGCAFFERMDFRQIGHYDVIIPARNTARITRVGIYGRRLGCTD